MTHPDRPDYVQLTVTNRASHRTTLVLEPLGEAYPMAPGETRLLRCTFDSVRRLSIDVHDDELKLWEDGGGQLEVES